MKKLLLLAFLFYYSPSFSQTVQTLAGDGTEGLLNGPALEAQFYNPEQTIVDQAGNIYVSDFLNHVIRKITPDGVVSTFAGSGIAGDVNGPKEEAQFNRPIGLTIDEEQNIYFSESINAKIKVIRPNGMVETIAGNGTLGYNDGPAANAEFNRPTAIVADGHHNIFVSENNNDRIRKIDLTTMMVSTFAGSGIRGLKDGIATEAQFNSPRGLTIDQYDNLYVGDQYNNAIRKITPDGFVTTLAGDGIAGHLDGPGNKARFNGPKSLVVDSTGNVFVADRLNFVVRKIDAQGMVSTVAGVPGLSGYSDGKAGESLFGRPVAVSFLGQDSILVTDWENDVIRLLDLNFTDALAPLPLPANASIKLVPNPAQGEVSLSGELGPRYQLILSDLQGRQVLQQQDRPEFDVSDLGAGIYFLQIIGADYFNVEKLMVE